MPFFAERATEQVGSDDGEDGSLIPSSGGKKSSSESGSCLVTSFVASVIDPLAAALPNFVWSMFTYVMNVCFGRKPTW